MPNANACNRLIYDESSARRGPQQALSGRPERSIPPQRLSGRCCDIARTGRNLRFGDLLLAIGVVHIANVKVPASGNRQVFYNQQDFRRSAARWMLSITFASRNVRAIPSASTISIRFYKNDLRQPYRWLHQICPRKSDSLNADLTVNQTLINPA